MTRGTTAGTTSRSSEIANLCRSLSNVLSIRTQQRQSLHDVTVDRWTDMFNNALTIMRLPYSVLAASISYLCWMRIKNSNEKRRLGRISVGSLRAFSRNRPVSFWTTRDAHLRGPPSRDYFIGQITLQGGSAAESHSTIVVHQNANHKSKSAYPIWVNRPTRGLG